MWKRIVDMKRPNANYYLDRIIVKAHKKAEEVKNKVLEDNCEYKPCWNMYEEQMGTNSVVDDVAQVQGENSVIKSQNGGEIAHIFVKKRTQQITEKLEYQNKTKNTEELNDEVFKRFMNNIQGAIREADQARHI
ncbi:hypothetical protein JTB14_034102 [Gonioctena quinquepunctata]|nr:hypothetical protein JTB14_034102 [Gonioctena quinquepunctata]